MRDAFLFMILVAADPSCPAPAWHDGETEAVLRRLAVKTELADEREMQGWNGSMLSWLRLRWQGTERYPYVGDADRYPATWLLTQNRDHLHGLRCHYEDVEKMGGYLGEEAIPLACEAARRVRAYEFILSARNDRQLIVQRREALWCLREMLGCEDYYAGVLPAPDL